MAVQASSAATCSDDKDLCAEDAYLKARGDGPIIDLRVRDEWALRNHERGRARIEGEAPQGRVRRAAVLPEEVLQEPGLCARSEQLAAPAPVGQKPYIERFHTDQAKAWTVTQGWGRHHVLASTVHVPDTLCEFIRDRANAVREVHLKWAGERERAGSLKVTTFDLVSRRNIQ